MITSAEIKELLRLPILTNDYVALYNNVYRHLTQQHLANDLESAGPYNAANVLKQYNSKCKAAVQELLKEYNIDAADTIEADFFKLITVRNYIKSGETNAIHRIESATGWQMKIDMSKCSVMLSKIFMALDIEESKAEAIL